jgi:hypothetical protein
MSKQFFAISLAALVLLGVAQPCAHAQATTTCPAGYWDMADVVMMDQSLRNNNYHLEGEISTPAGPDGNSYLNESAPSTNNSSSGKLQYVKTYQTAPGQTGLKGYPWDINLYDSQYIYLWVTEQSWADPWAYKKFNSGSNDYSMRLARRCVVPGDGNTSVIVNAPPSVDSSNNTNYINQPATLPPTPSSADCTAPSSSANLKYSRMTVQSTQSGFTFHDDVNNQTLSLTIVPVTYEYSCTTGAGGAGDCKFKEEFAYNNTYGWIRWQYWTSDGSTWSWQKTSLHDHLKPNDGNSGVFFPCF